MNKWIYAVALLLGLSVMIPSCTSSKEEKEEEENDTSLIGTWRSTRFEELNELGETIGSEATNECSVEFTEDYAILDLFDITENGNAIQSNYKITTVDGESIITFPDASSKYEQRIAGQISNGQLIIYQTSDEWDYSFMYYCTKAK